LKYTLAMSNRNTILKLKGIPEYIAVTEGVGLHLTGERDRAFVWDEQTAKTIKSHWEKRNGHTLQELPYILFPARFKPLKKQQYEQRRKRKEERNV